VATKIKLMRLGKMRAPYYRIVVADARTKRDGRSIETIGKYHPKQDPSFIEVDSDRAQYWLGVGAQPTEAVAAILRVTGDWQRFKGEPAPPPMKVAEAKVDKKAVFEAAARQGLDGGAGGAATTPKKRAGKKADDDDAPAGHPPPPAEAQADAPGAGAPAAPAAPAPADAAPAPADAAPAAPPTPADASPVDSPDVAPPGVTAEPAADAADAPAPGAVAETPGTGGTGSTSESSAAAMDADAASTDKA